MFVELCKDKSCVLDVCLCDACEVVCPKAGCWWRMGRSNPCVVVVVLVVA